MKTILEFSGNKKSIDLLDDNFENYKKHLYAMFFSFYKNGNKWSEKADILRFLTWFDDKNDDDYNHLKNIAKKKTSVYLLVKKSNKEKSHLVDFTHGYIDLIDKISSTFFSCYEHKANHLKYRHHSYLDVELKTNLRNTVFKKIMRSDFLKDFMFSTFYQHYQKDYDEISTYLNNHVFSSSNNKAIVDFDGNFDFNDYYLISLSFSFDRINTSTSKTSSVNEKLYFFLKHLQDVFNKNHYKHFIFIEKENKTNVDKSYVEFNHLIASKAQEAKRKILAELLNQKDNLDVLIEMVNEELIKQKSDNDDNFNLTVGENSIISKIENLENNIKTIFQQLKLL